MSTAIKRCRRTEIFFLLLAWPSLIYSFFRSFLRISTDSSSGKYSIGDSGRQIDDLEVAISLIFHRAKIIYGLRAGTCNQSYGPYESAWDGQALFLVFCATSKCGYRQSLYKDSSRIPTLH